MLSGASAGRPASRSVRRGPSRRTRVRWHGTTTLRALLAVASLAAVTSCSRAVEVAPAPQAAAPPCAAVAWPQQVSGHARLDTTPEAASVAAWGEPAVIARCGLDPLAPTTDACVTVDGVDWVVRELSDGSAATTYGRDPAIEVLAPATYGPVPLLLPAFSAAARTMPETGRRCS